MELSLSLQSRQMMIMALKQPHILEVKKICDYQKVNLSSCVLTVPHASSAAYTIRTEGHVTWYAISVKFCELAKYCHIMVKIWFDSFDMRIPFPKAHSPVK